MGISTEMLVYEDMTLCTDLGCCHHIATFCMPLFCIATVTIHYTVVASILLLVKQYAE